MPRSFYQQAAAFPLPLWVVGGRIFCSRARLDASHVLKSWKKLLDEPGDTCPAERLLGVALGKKKVKNELEHLIARRVFFALRDIDFYAHDGMEGVFQSHTDKESQEVASKLLDALKLFVTHLDGLDLSRRAKRKRPAEEFSETISLIRKVDEALESFGRRCNNCTSYFSEEMTATLDFGLVSSGRARSDMTIVSGSSPAGGKQVEHVTRGDKKNVSPEELATIEKLFFNDDAVHRTPLEQALLRCEELYGRKYHPKKIAEYIKSEVENDFTREGAVEKVRSALTALLGLSAAGYYYVVRTVLRGLQGRKEDGMPKKKNAVRRQQRRASKRKTL